MTGKGYALGAQVRTHASPRTWARGGQAGKLRAALARGYWVDSHNGLCCPEGWFAQLLLCKLSYMQEQVVTRLDFMPPGARC